MNNKICFLLIKHVIWILNKLKDDWLSGLPFNILMTGENVNEISMSKEVERGGNVRFLEEIENKTSRNR